MSHPVIIPNGLQLDFTPADGGSSDHFLAYDSSGSIVKYATLDVARLTAQNPNVVAVYDGSGFLTSSLITATQLGYLTDVTSNIQAQINSKQNTISLTAARAVMSTAGGLLGVSPTTSIELGYVSGVTSAIQTQLNAKQATITGGASSIVTSNLTAGYALISDGSGKVAVSGTTTTEIGYVSGVTSGIQSQLDSKLTVVLTSPASGDIISYNGTNWINTPSPSMPAGGSTNQFLVKNSGTDYDTTWHTLVMADVTDISATAAEINVLSGITSTTAQLNYLNTAASDIQVQINNRLINSLALNSIFVGNASNTASQLGPGANGTVLTIVSGAPVWQTVTGTGSVTSVDVSGGSTGLTFSGGPVTTTGTITMAGTLGTTHGGTNLTSYATGDILYASASNVLSKLTATTDGYVLTLSSGVPVWAAAPGAGTVTTVSVVTANGVSGSVSNPTTTPAITLSLGAITPSTVNGLTLTAVSVGFTIAGGTTSKTLTVPLDASVSGTNTGDQTITLTGDVTGSGTGSFATTIAAAAVTYSKIQNVSATNRLLGRFSSGAGSIEEVALGLGFSFVGGVLEGQFYGTIESGGTPLIQEIVLNFTSGLSAVDNGGATRTDASVDLTYNFVWTGTHSFQSSKLSIYNPAVTHVYTLVGSAIAADRNITLPLLTGNDTMVTAAFTQTLTNKTLGSGTKVLLGSDATGDIYYNGGSGTLTRLAAGSSTTVLHGGTSPSWSKVDLTADVTLVLGANNGGTGNGAPTDGDLLVGNSSTYALLSAVATGSVLASQGVGVKPAYASVTNGLTATTTNVKLGGTLTGATSLTSNAANQWTFDGTWTASANNQYHMTFSPTITGDGTLGDYTNGILFNPTMTAAQNNQVLAGVDITGTLSAGGKTGTTLLLFRVRTGSGLGNDVFTVDSSGNVNFRTIGTTPAAYTFNATTSKIYSDGNTANFFMGATSSGASLGAYGWYWQAGTSGAYGTTGAFTFTNGSNYTQTSGTGRFFTIQSVILGPSTGTSAFTWLEYGSSNTVSSTNSSIVTAKWLDYSTLIQTTGTSTLTFSFIDFNPSFNLTSSNAATLYGVLIRDARMLNSFGAGGTPTAIMHLGAGTATVGPFKLTSGTNLTTAVAGNLEYNNSLYFTKNSGLRFGIGGEIFEAYADAGNTSTTETDLHSYTTPANTLEANGAKIKAQYVGKMVASSTATRQLRVYFGGTMIYDSTAQNTALGAGFSLEVTIIRVSSTVVRYSIVTGLGGFSSDESVGELTGLTLSNTNILKLTGQAGGTGAATNDIVLKFARANWLPVSNN